MLEFRGRCETPEIASSYLRAVCENRNLWVWNFEKTTIHYLFQIRRVPLPHQAAPALTPTNSSAITYGQLG